VKTRGHLFLEEAGLEEEGEAQADGAEAEDRDGGAEGEGGAVEGEDQVGLQEEGAAASQGAWGPGQCGAEEGGAPPAAAVEGDGAADALRSQGAELEAELGLQRERPEAADRAEADGGEVQREVGADLGARGEAGGAAKPSRVAEGQAKARPGGAEGELQAGGDAREDADGDGGAGL
jgi:hypothetical protein